MNENVGIIKIQKAFDSLRSSDCTVESFFGETIDNSLEHGGSVISTGITTRIEEISFGKKAKEIEVAETVYILDDGEGITPDNLPKALALGESMPNTSACPAISKFGVGLSLSAIAIGRHVDIYSRTSPDTPFMYTYIDIDEIINSQENGMIYINPAVPKDIPSEFVDFYEGEIKRTGTIVVISKLDKLSGDMSLVHPKVMYDIGRTFRKYLSGGRLEITYNGNNVFLHDPLYLDGPTMFDAMDAKEPKATVWDKHKIWLDIPNKPGEKAAIEITISLLPEAWRNNKGDGRSSDAKKRKIPDNEGISILRENREVYHGKLPRLVGKTGDAAYRDVDRWWGLEISYPATLDSYFKVRYIKNGIEPNDELRAEINRLVYPAIAEIRKVVSSHWRMTEETTAKESGAYDKVEEAAEKTNATSKSSKRGKSASAEEEEAFLKVISEHLKNTGESTEEDSIKREKRIKEIKDKPLTLIPCDYPSNVLFEPVYRMSGRITIRLNVNHPFYNKFIVPLCGSLDDDDVTADMLAMRDAIYLIFAAYAKASSLYDNDVATQILDGHLTEMGSLLSNLVKNYDGGISID